MPPLRAYYFYLSLCFEFPSIFNFIGLFLLFENTFSFLVFTIIFPRSQAHYSQKLPSYIPLRLHKFIHLHSALHLSNYPCNSCYHSNTFIHTHFSNLPHNFLYKYFQSPNRKFHIHSFYRFYIILHIYQCFLPLFSIALAHLLSHF